MDNDGATRVVFYDNGKLKIDDETSDQILKIPLILQESIMLNRNRDECHMFKEVHVHIMHNQEDLYPEKKYFLKKFVFMSNLVLLEGFLNQKVKNKNIVEVYAVLTSSCLMIYNSQIAYKENPNTSNRTINFSDHYNIIEMPFDTTPTFSLFKRGEKADERLYLVMATKHDYSLWFNLIDSLINKISESEKRPSISIDIPSSPSTNLPLTPSSHSTKLSVASPSTNLPVASSPLSTKFPVVSSPSTKLPVVSHSPSTNLSVVSSSPSTKMPAAPASPLSKQSAFNETDKVSIPKVNSTKYIIRTSSPSAETKQSQLKQNSDKFEANLKNEQRILKEVLHEKEQLKRKLADLEKLTIILQEEKANSISEINNLKQQVAILKTSIKENYEYNDKQLEKAGVDIGLCLDPSMPNSVSYHLLIDYLCSTESHSTFLNSFLRHQLECLLHKTSMETSSGQSLCQYLTTTIDMSLDSIVTFISTFLLTLSRKISPKPSTGGDLSPTALSTLQQVVHMVSPSQSTCSNKSFQQISLEIAYLLAQSSSHRSQLSNGYNIEVKDLDEKFNDLLSSFNIEVVNKVFIIELTEHIQEKHRIKSSTLVQAEPSLIEKNIIQKHFDVVLENISAQLIEREEENADLRIVISEFSRRNLELEAAMSSKKDWRKVDSMINYYTSISYKLCSHCQNNVADILKMPVENMIDKLISEFTIYWQSINDITAFLTKKRSTNSDVKEALEMMKKSSLKFETLMEQLHNITQRTISNPGTCD